MVLKLTQELSYMFVFFLKLFILLVPILFADGVCSNSDYRGR